MAKLILASSSPRRKELLRSLGLPFTVHASGIRENFSNEKLSPVEHALRLADEKAGAVRRLFPDSMVLAADTIVCLKGKILAKPATGKDAFQMLALLNGKCHEVVTAVALAYKTRTLKTHSVTRVWFRKNSPELLRWYVRTGEPMDKAGAYGIQGKGGLLIRKIEGDYFNVVGLPLAKVWELISKVDREFLPAG